MPQSSARRPTWTERYRLGVQLSKELDTYCTLEEIAVELGTTKQNAYTASVLALGTLAIGLQQKFGGSAEV